MQELGPVEEATFSMLNVSHPYDTMVHTLFFVHFFDEKYEATTQRLKTQ